MNSAEGPVISTKETSAPMATESSEVMDTLEENVPLENETKSNSIPVIAARNIGVTTKTTINELDIPPAISPINSPLKKKESKEEIHLIFCAIDERKAFKLLNKLPYFQNPKYVDSKENPHHFIFSVHLKTSDIPDLKNAMDEINKKVNLIQFQVSSNQLNYFPRQPNHCRECQDNHFKS